LLNRIAGRKRSDIGNVIKLRQKVISVKKSRVSKKDTLPFFYVKILKKFQKELTNSKKYAAKPLKRVHFKEALPNE